jgi:hypothetical protein
MTAIVGAVVALLTNFLPLISSSSQVSSIVSMLIQIIPTVVKEAQDLVQPIKNIIAALQTNAATTAEQLAQLQTLDAVVDASFDAAATAALAEDATANPATPNAPPTQ